jgi:hypothetical protein
VKLGHLRFIFKGQLSILLRLLEFVRNRELSKLSNKDIAENPHAQLGALLSSCAPLAFRASVAHLRCALRDVTWVTLSQVMSPVCGVEHVLGFTKLQRGHSPRLTPLLLLTTCLVWYPILRKCALFSWEAASRMWYASMYREELLFNVVGYLRGSWEEKLSCVGWGFWVSMLGREFCSRLLMWGRGCSSHVLSINLSTLTSCAKRLLTFV